MRLARLVAVPAAFLLLAVPWAVQAQSADPYVSCVKCHALPTAQAQGQMAQHGSGYPPSPETACGMCHDTYSHERDQNGPISPRYLLSPDPTSGPASYLTNFCATCHPANLHGHKFDDFGNPLLEAMPYGTPPMGASAVPTSVLPLFDPSGMAIQDPFMGGMVCSTCHDPHEPSYPYGQNGLPKFLRVGSTANINQLCSACHDAPFPSGAAPDLVIPARSNSVSFETGPAGDQQISVTVKNRGSAPYPGGFAEVSWIDGMGYPMPIGSLMLPWLFPEEEMSVFFGWMPPPGWSAAEGFYVFSLPASDLLPGASKEFVRAMNVTPVPANVRVVATGSTGIELAWDPPVAPAAISWDVYRDGVKVNQYPLYSPGFFDGILAPETPHLYAVVAVVDGIESEKSALVVGTTTPGFFIDVPRDMATIQEAIDAAGIGTSIRVAPGTYTEPFSFAGKFGITIKCQDANGCVLDYSAAPGTIIDLGPDYPPAAGNTIAGFTVRDAKILMHPGDVLSGCVVLLDEQMPPVTYGAIEAWGGLAAHCVFDAPFPAANIPPGGFFAAVNSIFLYPMPLWHEGTPQASAALLVNNCFDGWPQYVEYQGSGNFTGSPVFEPPGPWPPPGTYFTTPASPTTDRGLPLGEPNTYVGPAPDVGVFEVGRSYTPQPPGDLAAGCQPGLPGSVRLDWTASTDAQRVWYYLIYRSTTPSFPTDPGTPYASVPGNALTFTDFSIEPQAAYYYQVRASAGPAAPPATGELLSAPSNTVSAECRNLPPVALDDAFSTDEDTQLVVIPPGVLANDFDPDTPQLFATVVSVPSHGTLELDPAFGGFVYNPSPDFGGTDAFTYNVYDGSTYSNVATVTITVRAVNDAPTAVDDTTSAPSGTPVSVAVLGNDSDVDGDVLAISGVTQPAHGTAAVAGDAVTYTGIAGYTGPDSFSYTVSDGKGGTATALVSVTVAPRKMHVESISMSVGYKSRNVVFAAAGITVMDESGEALAGVAVTGHWSGLTSDTDTGGTGDNGAAIVDSDAVRNANGTFTFTVDTAVRAGYELDVNASQMSQSLQYPAPPPPPPPPGVMHVREIGMGVVIGKNSGGASATVYVVDADGAAVPGATVTGAWSGAVTGTSSGITAPSGGVEILSPKIKNAGGKTFTFTVTGITLSGWTYDSAANLETSDSIVMP